MNKDQKQAFLRSGGTLLRVSVNKFGQAIIKQKTIQTDWHVRVPVPSKDTGIKIVETLCSNQPSKFKTE